MTAINQDFYQSLDPTQRRNCHYLVLFNTPIDKRQTYPEHLVITCHGSRNPYGHLLVDLKPTIPENWCLRHSGVYKRTNPTTNSSDVVQTLSRKELCTYSPYIMQRETFKRKRPGRPAFRSYDEEVEPYLKERNVAP